MDPVTALAAGVISFLSPHLAELAKKTTEKAVEKVSEALPEQVGQL